MSSGKGTGHINLVYGGEKALVLCISIKFRASALQVSSNLSLRQSRAASQGSVAYCCELYAAPGGGGSSHSTYCEA